MKDESLKIQALIEKPINDLQAREFLSVGNVAELLGFSRKMIYRMIAAGQLRAINLSVRKTVVQRKEIDRLFGEEPVRGSDVSDIYMVKPSLSNSYSIGEAQKKFNISEAGLYQLIKRHKIPKYKKGRAVYVAKRELDIIFDVS